MNNVRPFNLEFASLVQTYQIDLFDTVHKLNPAMTL